MHPILDKKSTKDATNQTNFPPAADALNAGNSPVDPLSTIATTQLSKGNPRKVITQLPIVKLNSQVRALGQRGCKRIVMLSLRGIEMAPIIESACPIWAGYTEGCMSGARGDKWRMEKTTNIKPQTTMLDVCICD